MAKMVEEEKTIEQRRRERVPLGGGHQRLAAPGPRPGYVQRWINDDPGRVQQALAGGYQFVVNPEAPKSDNPYAGENETTDTGSNMSRVVGASTSGHGKRAYLMEIPEDWYNEDQAAKQAHLDSIDAQIDKNRFENKIDVGHMHPDAETRIQRPNKPT